MVEYPTVEQIIRANKRVIEEIKVKKADRHKVDRRAAIRDAIDRCKNHKGDIHTKATILLAELLRSHSFASANRRTAFSVTITFLRRNGENPKVRHNARVLQGIRERFYTNIEIKNWLKGNETRPFSRG